MAAALIAQIPPAAIAKDAAIAAAEDRAAEDRAADEAAIREGAAAWGAAFILGDTGTIDRLLADDFVGTAKDGSLYDKAAMLGWARKGPNITSNETKVRRIRFFGDIAIATGTDDMVGPAPALQRIKSIWTDIWVRRNGQWRVVAAHDMAGPPD